MNSRLRLALFALFLVSGFSSLVYQIVWMRLAFASFGIVTPVLSTVISIFMLGLALGTFAGGRLVESRSVRRVSPMALYGSAELLIALGALAVPILFVRGETHLLLLGASDSNRYLLESGAWIAVSLLPWCFLMGTTVPFMMAFVKRLDARAETGFSFLYRANVIGAMAGTVGSAIVLIELLGFRQTLLVAAAGNIVIGLSALGLAARFRGVSLPASPAARGASPRLPRESPAPKRSPICAILFATGFASLAMEVVWTRAFTAVLRTTIYAFASLLATYLLATWIGSSLYRRDLARSRVIPTARLMALLPIAALLPVLLGDPRLLLRLNGFGLYLDAATVYASVFPLSALLGYLTPKLIDTYSRGFARTAGFAYALNIVGGILGPLCAGYLLLPLLGVRHALIVLALPFVGFVMLALRSAEPARRERVGFGIASLAVLCVATFGSLGLEEIGGVVDVKRDHTATVINAGEGKDRLMIVNGVPMTAITPVTKHMAHLPLLHLPHPPQEALVICFGIGTTFRSLMSWGVNVTAVELVPSVVASFPYYFDDAEALSRDPRADLVIDDGRRYLKRTTKRFDVITLDPPPPPEAAGSSLLYSTEFYELVRAHLADGGILQQWIPLLDGDILKAVVRSLLDEFAFVRSFRSEIGHYFLASDRPMEALDADAALARMPAPARRDLLEWSPDETARDHMERLLGREVQMSSLLDPADGPRLTDDRPYNEYFLLRTLARRMGGR